MMKKMLVLMMAVLMLFNAVPVNALAQNVDEPVESDVMNIDDYVWMPEGENPTYPVVETGIWVETEERATESRLVCAQAVHSHVANCPVDENGLFVCGDDAHEHVTDGCAADCAIAEHVHGEECYQEVSLVKWVVALLDNSMAAFAAQGLPICFFVASPEEASNANGRYAPFKSNLWGRQNGAAGYAYANAGVGDTEPIYSQLGIRTANDESLIVSNIFTLPSNANGVEMTMEEFKKFDTITIPGSGTSRDITYSYSDGYRIKWVTICWRNDTFSWPDWRNCGCGSNYDHIHIDGILTKVVEPGEMKLYKQLSTASSETQEFTFKLERLQQNADYSLPRVEAKDYSFADLTLTASIPAGSTSAVEITGTAGVQIGFGYYKLTETESNDAYKQRDIKIGSRTYNTTGSLYIHVNTDGSVRYSTSYNSGYTTSTAGATVVNEPIPMTEVSVEKVWNDDGNRDGIRPDSVEVHLLKNNMVHYGATVTLNAENGWEASWTVPAVDHNGNTISYHVEEVVPEGYTEKVTGSASTGFVITNTHVSETTNVVAHKVWNDDDNREGERPTSIRVQLYADGVAYGDAVTVTADTSWTHQWNGLLKNSNGKDIVYSVEEVAVPNGYTVAYSTDDTGRLVITNSREMSKVNVSVSKSWNDDDNRDGIRPESVTVTLYANGIALTSAGTTQVLSEENGWSYTWTDLYEYYRGQKINYTVVEQSVEGYSADYSKADAASGDARIVVINSHTPALVSVPVTKIWDDGNNQDGKRPADITVELYADGIATGKTLSLSAANNWSGSFDGLDKFEDGKVGKEISYTVKESAVAAGYDVSYDGSTITNSHTPETADLKVQKIWDDSNNQDGKRPEAVVITLYANGHPLRKGADGKPAFEAAEGEFYTVTLNEANSWAGVWNGMPRYHNGQRISYTVVETGHYDTLGGQLTAAIPEGYSATYGYDTAKAQATVTNSYAPELTALNVQKIWDDDDNRDGVRPASVSVKLVSSVQGSGVWEDVKVGGITVTAVLSPDNEWDHDFTGLPRYSAGKEIIYNVVETTNDPNYTVSYDFDSATRVVVITNTHESAKTSVSVSKKWIDDNDRDRIRPESVTVKLYANNVDMGEGYEKVLDASNGWSAKWEGLNKNYAGQAVVYTVLEKTVPAGYTATVTGTAEAGCVITNTHEIETVSVPVYKVWDDDNDRDGKRPDSVKVTLYANGEALRTRELSAENNWQYVFPALAKKADGVDIVYTVGEAAEDVPEGYTASVEGNTITNTYETETVDFTAVKVWEDADNQDNKRPTEIVLHLLANGEHMGESYEATVSAANVNAKGEWEYTWTGLHKYRNGQPIQYTVMEEAVAEYTATHEYDTANAIATITNSYTPELTSISVQKIWADDDNRDGVRPDSIKVQLVRNYMGDWQYVKNSDGSYAFAVLSPDNEWGYDFTGLPKYDDGEEIVYDVIELAEDDNYTSSSEFDKETRVVTITNTHEVKRIDVSVLKVWNDQDNRDGIRPTDVKVTLYANGIATSETVTLNAGNGWSHTWENLYEYYRGNEITYTVVEQPVAGYTAGVVVNEVEDGENKGDETHIITNSHEPEKTSVSVSKVWDDNNNQDGIRPASIVVELLADGKETGKTVTLSAANNWRGTFADMQKYADGKVGKLIEYTVEETAVEGYTASYNGTTVTNSHTPETANLRVQKVWDDSNNQDGKRPEAVVITLYANGHPLRKGTDGQPDFEATEGELYTVTLTAGKGWTDGWNGMPRYHNGQRVSYTVVETGYYTTLGGTFSAGIPEGYTVTHNYDTANALATVTNSYTPELTSINVQKIWDDDDNRDGVRPASVTVKLVRSVSKDAYGSNIWEDVLDGGTAVSAVLSPANEWDHDFTGLPKYHEGTEILYNVAETLNDANYTASYEFDKATRVATITNTHEVKRVDVSVSKSWDDANNQDGLRPEGVKVTLYANGVATSETVTLNAGNGWSYKWKDLYACYMGKSISYTVVEEAVEGYTVAVVTETDESTGDVTVALTNKHETEKIAVPVSKIWADDDNRDGMRPESVTVTLYADGTAVKTQVLNEENKWQFLFEGLDKKANGKDIVYTVGEAKADIPEGYTASVNAETNAITNTHKAELIDFTAVKVWDDDNDRDGIRPDTIVLHLLANGEHMEELFPGKGYKVTVAEAEDGSWSYTWKDLYKYREGEAIRYTVYEEPIVKGEDTIYNASYVRDSQTQVTVTNSHAIETTTVSAIKVWDDDDDRDGLRPESVTVELKIDGKASGKTLTLSEENDWEAFWTGLPKYRDQGTEIVYSVSEKPVNGYEEPVIKQEEEFDPGVFIITNTHEAETTGISIKKVWDDENNNDGARPDGLIVQLYADGAEVVGGRTVLNDENYWSHSWKSSETMPLYVYKTTVDEQGTKKTEQIRYTVREVGYVEDGVEYEGMPDGYTGSDPKVDGYEVTITNTRASEKITLGVNKVWEDADNNDGFRPEGVKVTLKKGDEKLETVTLDESNDWAYTWSNLYRYQGGVVADYTIEEEVVEGYTASYEKVTDEKSGNVKIEVTNTHEITTKDFAVEKVWKDDNDKEELRPTSVTVQIYKNGEAYGDKIVLSAENKWKAPITLPVYEDGKKIEWTIKELGIPRYYTVSYDQNTMTVVNTIQSSEIPKTGDYTNLWLWILLLGCCGAGAGAVMIFDKKKKAQK